jgi:hypothetical protein
MQKISICEQEFSDFQFFEIFTFKNSRFIKHIKSRKIKTLDAWFTYLKAIWFINSWFTCFHSENLARFENLLFFAFLISIDVESNQSKTFENNYARFFLDHWLTFLEKIHLKNIKNSAWLYRIIIINESSLHFVNSSKRASIEIKEISSRQTF